MENTMIKKVEVAGIEYTLQKMGPRSYLRLLKACTINGAIDQEKWSDAMLEHVVIEPKVTMEDFEDDLPAFIELIATCDNFLAEKTKTTKK